jgi:opacity protein-like surface antigen
MSNAKLPEGGLSVGGRSGSFLGVFRAYSELYGLVSPSKHTADAVGEFTGTVQKITFGYNFGFYISDYFYFCLNPIPYMNYIYTSGRKIRPLPGRTTDLGRAWDSGVAASAGLEFKLIKRFSVGVEWRDISIIKRSLSVDSSGFAYDDHYYGLTVKYWY